jgi:RimJ/RimL family protein N-acetyltransferase
MRCYAAGMKTVMLENAFVRLEPLEPRHREPLRAAANDPDLWRFHSFNQHGGTHGGNFDTWFDHYMAEAEAGRSMTWAVVEKASGACAGSTSFLVATNIPMPFRKVEIGNTWYSKPWWAGAVNPSCKLLLFAHAFDDLVLNRVELKLDATNVRSFRAIARLGARFEGIHRAHMVLPDGRIRDTAWFSVLRAEWPEVRAGLEARLEAFGR